MDYWFVSCMNFVGRLLVRLEGRSRSRGERTFLQVEAHSSGWNAVCMHGAARVGTQTYTIACTATWHAVSAG